jgi:hypothetical protein
VSRLAFPTGKRAPQQARSGGRLLRSELAERTVAVDLNMRASLYRASLLVGLAAAALGGPAAATAQADPPATAAPATARTVTLVNGQWFNGRSFEPRTVYSVGGHFTATRPARVDTTVDLAGTWVVPPFGEAHNHNIDGAAEGRTRAALARYLADGVFYVQIQGNFPVSDSLRRRLPMNRPDGPDVALAQAFVTASGGHPVQLHETVLLPQGYYPGFTRERLRDSLYVTLDSEADLDRKWPQIRALHPDFIKAILWGSDEYARGEPEAPARRGRHAGRWQRQPDGHVGVGVRTARRVRRLGQPRAAQAVERGRAAGDLPRAADRRARRRVRGELRGAWRRPARRHRERAADPVALQAGRAARTVARPGSRRPHGGAALRRW